MVYKCRRPEFPTASLDIYHIIIMKASQQQSQSRNDYVNTLQSKASHTAPQSSAFVFHHDET